MWYSQFLLDETRSILSSQITGYVNINICGMDQLIPLCGYSQFIFYFCFVSFHLLANLVGGYLVMACFSFDQNFLMEQYQQSHLMCFRCCLFGVFWEFFGKKFQKPCVLKCEKCSSANFIVVAYWKIIRTQPTLKTLANSIH